MFEKKMHDSSKRPTGRAPVSRRTQYGVKTIFVQVNGKFSQSGSTQPVVYRPSEKRPAMSTGRRLPVILAVMAGFSVASCNLPDPYYQGKMHEPTPRLTKPEILAGVLTRVAHNAEKAKEYETAELFYRRAHQLDRKKTEPLVGLGRTLTALNEPLDASEAYGAALAVDEGNKEAVAGLAKSLEQIAARSAKNRPTDIPPPAVKKMTPPDKAAAPKDAMSMKGVSDSSTMSGMGSASAGYMYGAAPERPTTIAKGPLNPTGGVFGSNGMVTRAPMPKAPSAPAPKAADKSMAAAKTTKNAKGQPVNLDDVLSAIEWKADKKGATPGGVPTASEPGSVQTAQIGKPALPRAMATEGKATDDKTQSAAVPETPKPARVTSKPMIAGVSMYGLQFAAFSSAKSAEKVRAKVEAKVKPVIGDASITVEKDPAKPIYRVKSTAVGDRLRAASLCARIKTLSVSCFLVRQGAKRAAPKKSAAIAPPPTRAPAAKPDPKPMSPPATKKAAAMPKPAAKAPPKEGEIIRWEVIKDLNKSDPEPEKKTATTKKGAKKPAPRELPPGLKTGPKGLAPEN